MAGCPVDRVASTVEEADPLHVRWTFIVTGEARIDGVPDAGRRQREGLRCHEYANTTENRVVRSLMIEENERVPRTARFRKEPAR